MIADDSSMLVAAPEDFPLGQDVKVEGSDIFWLCVGLG